MLSQAASHHHGTPSGLDDHPRENTKTVHQSVCSQMTSQSEEKSYIRWLEDILRYLRSDDGYRRSTVPDMAERPECSSSLEDNRRSKRPPKPLRRHNENGSCIGHLTVLQVRSSDAKANLEMNDVTPTAALESPTWTLRYGRCRSELLPGWSVSAVITGDKAGISRQQFLVSHLIVKLSHNCHC